MSGETRTVENIVKRSQNNSEPRFYQWTLNFRHKSLNFRDYVLIVQPSLMVSFSVPTTRCHLNKIWKVLPKKDTYTNFLVTLVTRSTQVYFPISTILNTLIKP